jgi:hypothetical protein
VRLDNGRLVRVAVPIKDAQGALLATAIPKVTIVKHARYLPEDTSGDPEAEVDILARIAKNLREGTSAGFVAEGSAPFASMSNAVEAVLRRATLSGMPVVKVDVVTPRGGDRSLLRADSRRQTGSNRYQGPPAPDGLPAAFREPAASGGSTAAHPSRVGGCKGEAHRISGSV